MAATRWLTSCFPYRAMRSPTPPMPSPKSTSRRCASLGWIAVAAGTAGTSQAYSTCPAVTGRSLPLARACRLTWCRTATTPRRWSRPTSIGWSRAQPHHHSKAAAAAAATGRSGSGGLAWCLRFSLPSSVYATMFLRELLHQPLESDEQARRSRNLLAADAGAADPSSSASSSSMLR